MLMFDQKDDFCKTTYKIVRSKQADPLQEVPTQWSFQAVLLRSKIGSIALKIDQFRAIRPFAELRFGEAKIQFVKQVGDRVFFKHLEGIVPVRGTLTASFTADTVDEIASEVADFWTPMWLRTSVKSNFQLKHGAILKKFLHMRIYRKYHLFQYPADDINFWMRIVKKLPSSKAVGPCGWSNDELKALPEFASVI